MENIELSISLKEKIPFDKFIYLPTGPKKVKICFITSHLSCAIEGLDFIPENDLSKFADSRKGRKLARQFDYFVIERAAMPIVMKTIGRWLGCKGKLMKELIVNNEKELTKTIDMLLSSVHLVAKAGIIGCSIPDAPGNMEAVLAAIPPFRRILIKEPGPKGQAKEFH